MTNTEKLQKDLNLRLARFGDVDVASEKSPLPSIPSMDMKRLQRETAAKLVFKIE